MQNIFSDQVHMKEAILILCRIVRLKLNNLFCRNSAIVVFFSSEDEDEDED
jgi:hypothetical protein